MTLTVPRAGVIGGAAAQLRPVPAPQFGEAAAQLGGAIKQLGDTIEAERLDREAQRLQLDITRDLGKARLEFEQMTDPDQIDAAWPERMAAIRAHYFDGTREDGRPRVDPKLRGRMDLAFTELADRHAYSLASNAIALRHSQREATWIDYSREVTTQAATADPATRETLIAQADGQIDSLLAAGTITPEEAARRKQALRGEVTAASAITLIDTDPVGFLEAADAGEFAELGAEGLARARVQATGELARREAAAAAQLEKDQQLQARRVNDELDQLITLTQGGRRAQQLAMLANPTVRAVADPEKLAEADAMAALLEETPTLAEMTLPQLDAQIAAERERSLSRDYEARRMTILEDLRDAKAEAIRTDIVAAGQSAGAIGAPIEFDPADELAFRGALRTRRDETDLFARREGQAAPPVPLTEAERETLRERAKVTTDPAERAVLARSVAAELGDAGVRQISDDPVFAHMAGFLAAGGNERLAQRAFRGQQVLDAQNIVLPPLKDRLDPQFEEMADLLDRLPGGEYAKAGIRATADAFYAEANRGIAGGRSGGGVTGDLDPDAYRQALHEAMGGTGPVDDDTARGGVQEVRGALTILPRGIGAGQVEDAFDRLGMAATVAQDEMGRPVDLSAFDAATLDRQLSAASRNGKAPRINGQPIDERTLRRLTLQAVGDDAYVLVYPDTGEAVLDEDGQELQLSLTRLLRVAQ